MTTGTPPPALCGPPRAPRSPARLDAGGGLRMLMNNLDPEVAEKRVAIRTRGAAGGS